MDSRNVSLGNLLIGSSGNIGRPAGYTALTPILIEFPRPVVPICNGRHVKSIRLRRERGSGLEFAGLNLRAHQEPNQLNGFLGMKRVSGNSQARTAQGTEPPSWTTRNNS